MSEITNQISDKKLLFDLLVKWEDNIREFCKKDFEEMKYSENLVEHSETFIFEGKELGFRADRIDIKDNEIVLIDYKTSKNAKNNEHYMYDFQTTFYYLWAKENYPDKKIKTVIWDLHEAKPHPGELKIEVLKKVLNNLPTKVKEAEDIIDGEQILKKAENICRYCEYKTACGRD